jgi:hypothetical protein
VRADFARLWAMMMLVDAIRCSGEVVQSLMERGKVVLEGERMRVEVKEKFKCGKGGPNL